VEGRVDFVFFGRREVEDVDVRREEGVEFEFEFEERTPSENPESCRAICVVSTAGWDWVGSVLVLKGEDGLGVEDWGFEAWGDWGLPIWESST